MLAQRTIPHTVHATVFKAANNNEPLDRNATRASTLMDRWLNAESDVRETVRSMR